MRLILEQLIDDIVSNGADSIIFFAVFISMVFILSKVVRVVKDYPDSED